MSCGVYKITCSGDGIFYIGASSNILSRWSYHRSVLKNNKHENKLLQRAYNKYGKDSISLEILEYSSKDELKNKEKIWINSFEENQLFNYVGNGNRKKEPKTIKAKIIRTEKLIERILLDKARLTNKSKNKVMNEEQVALGFKKGSLYRIIRRGVILSHESAKKMERRYGFSFEELVAEVK